MDVSTPPTTPVSVATPEPRTLTASPPVATGAPAPAPSSPAHCYTLTRDLDQTPVGSRHLVLSADHHTSHLLHRLDKLFAATTGAGPAPRDLQRARFEKVFARMQRADHPHILQVEEFGWDDQPASSAPGAVPFVISDYTGDADGVMTLERLITLKGGWLTLEESKRALYQLMSACAAAHAAGVIHGTLELSRIHVDRRGSLLIELYGLERELAELRGTSPAPPGFPDPGTAADEVRSICAIGYRLATGLLPIHPVIPVEHIVGLGTPGSSGGGIGEIDDTWRDFFQTGLATHGFSTAAHALASVAELRIAGGGALGGMRASLREFVRSMLTPVR